MSERLYLIVCMKRSNYPQHKVYWREDCAGYTEKLTEAGLYRALELDFCAGSNGDWIIEPIWPHRFDRLVEEE